MIIGKAVDLFNADPEVMEAVDQWASARVQTCHHPLHSITSLDAAFIERLLYLLSFHRSRVVFADVKALIEVDEHEAGGIGA